MDEGGLTASCWPSGVAGLVLAFACGGCTSTTPDTCAPPATSLSAGAMRTCVIFASLAAMGAGVQVAAEAVTGHGDARVAALAVAVPVAGFWSASRS